MADEKDIPILRRMAAASAGASARDGVRPAMFPSRALELALARAAQDELGLALSVGDLQEAAPQLEDLEAAAGDMALAALLDGPCGATGLAVLSAPVLAAVVAQRMTGRVPDTPRPPRPPTRVDAEIARDLIDRVLTAFGAALGPGGTAPWASGFRYRGYLSDARLVRFALPDTVYRGFRAELALAGGAVEGTVYLALPDAPAAGDGTAGRAAPGDFAPDWSAALSAQVLAAELGVEAVLTRLRLPLARVSALAPGDMLPLSGQAIGEVRLEGPGGALLATGRLGRSCGDRALRIGKLGPGAVQVPAPDGAERPEGVGRAGEGSPPGAEARAV